MDHESLQNFVTSLFSATFATPEQLSGHLSRHGFDANSTDLKGNSILHCAMATGIEPAPQTLKFLIHLGHDINQKNDLDETALYLACLQDHHDWIYSLIYYSADPTICDDNDMLPLLAYLYYDNLLCEERNFVSQVLLDYTYDGGNIAFDLTNMTYALMSDSKCVQKLIDMTPYVTYDDAQLKFFYKSMTEMYGENFRKFADKFDHILHVLSDGFDIISILARDHQTITETDSVEVLKVFVEHDCTPQIVDNFLNANDTFVPVIFNLIAFYRSCGTTDSSDLSSVVCGLFSYGWQYVTYTDLDILYDTFGFCELFDVLLHMNLNRIDYVNSVFTKKPMMAALCYDVKFTIEDLLEDFRFYVHFDSALDFFVSYKLNELCLLDYKPFNRRFKEIEGRVMNLPKVPSLLQLARDVSRSMLVERYAVRNFADLSSVVRRQRIGTFNEEIILYERRLYRTR